MKHTTHLSLLLLTLSSTCAIVSTNSLRKAVKSGNIAKVQQLLDKGAYVNEAYDGPYSIEEYTSLHEAAKRGDLEIAKLLLSYGATVDYQVDDGNWGGMTDTPLAVAAKNNHFEVVKLLLENGAHIFASGDHSHTIFSSLSYSARTRIIELLLELINNGKLSSYEMLLNDFVRETVRSDKLSSNETLFTILLGLIVGSGNATAVAKQLLENGANANGFTRGYTPLHTAAQSGNLEIAKLLLSYGATVDIMQRDARKTPLAVAAQDYNHGGGENKHYEVCKLLLEKGANPNVKIDQRPLIQTVRNPKIKKLLKKHGARR